MAKPIDSYTKIAFASTYTRVNGQPMDDTVVWNSLEEAQNYARTDKAFVGQVLTVVTNNGTKEEPAFTSKVYVVDNTDGDLVEVGSKIDIVQETGNSEKKVMSQKSVSDLFYPFGHSIEQTKTGKIVCASRAVKDKTITVTTPDLIGADIVQTNSNLFSPYSVFKVENSVTSNGVTIAHDGNGTFTVNGTALGNIKNLYMASYTDNVRCPAGSYIISLNAQIPKGVRVQFAAYRMHDNTYMPTFSQDYNKGLSYEGGIIRERRKFEEDFRFQALIYINEGTEIDGLVLKPQLTPVGCEVTEWEKPSRVTYNVNDFAFSEGAYHLDYPYEHTHPNNEICIFGAGGHPVEVTYYWQMYSMKEMLELIRDTATDLYERTGKTPTAEEIAIALQNVPYEDQLISWDTDVQSAIQAIFDKLPEVTDALLNLGIGLEKLINGENGAKVANATNATYAIYAKKGETAIDIVDALSKINLIVDAYEDIQGLIDIGVATEGVQVYVSDTHEVYVIVKDPNTKVLTASRIASKSYVDSKVVGLNDGISAIDERVKALEKNGGNGGTSNITIVDRNGVTVTNESNVMSYTAVSNSLGAIEGNLTTVTLSLESKLSGADMSNENGAVWARQSFSAPLFRSTSDARLKENIKSYKCENSILNLDVKQFDYIGGAKDQIGCLAQDLQKICPQIVNEDEKGYLSILESKIVYLLLEEVKKLRKEVDELKSGA